MKPICSVCGRRTAPFAFIGAEPIGPNCARKLGLTKTAVKAAKHGRMRLAGKYAREPKSAEAQTIDLFPETLSGSA